VTRGTCYVDYFFQSFACAVLAQCDGEGRARRGSNSRREQSRSFSTGGIVDKASQVEPRCAPNKAGPWTRSSELRGFFHGVGWRAHAEARVSVASHNEWCRCGSLCTTSFFSTPMSMLINLAYTVGHVSFIRGTRPTTSMLV
jgi:hypothetical protein